MFTILLFILLFAALGMMVTMFVAIGYWFVPVILIVLCGKSLIKALTKLVKTIRGDEQVVMFKKDLDKNYVHISKLKVTQAAPVQNQTVTSAPQQTTSMSS